MSKQKNIAIIFAGGTGQRFGSEIPKQFVNIYGKQIIVHTLEAFQNHPEIDEIYIGCISDWIPYLRKLIKSYSITKVPEDGIVSGGDSGQDTIYKILCKAHENSSDDDIVLIHDGVRPIVTNKEISDNIASVKKYGSGVTCIPFAETPVFSEDGEFIDKTLARQQMFRGVAPQSFRLKHILDAHLKIREKDPEYSGTYNNGTIVDSASLVKAAFDERCAIVEGNPNNMKVTNMGDFFALLGILQSNDVANYFIGQKANSFPLNSAMLYSQQKDSMEHNEGGVLENDN